MPAKSTKEWAADAAAIGVRLAEARGGRKLSPTELARLSGVTRQTVWNWERGEGLTGTARLPAVADALGISLTWLLTGRGSPTGHDDTPMGDPDWGARVVREALERGLGQHRPPEDFVLVPRYDVQASAGPGALTTEENVLDHMAFRRAWVRSALGVNPGKLALITAVGDSMEPAIRAGDLLLVDTGVDRVIDDSIYVLIKEGWVVVKRLQRFFNGVVIVKSDNARYVEETVGPEQMDELHVAGRVRWIGRMI